MPVVPRPKMPEIDWSDISEKIGDFLVDKFSMPDKHFVDKYGEEWESKRERARENVKSLYGLLPAKDTSEGMVALEALSYAVGAPIIGKLINVYHGQRAGLSLYQMFKKGKWVGGGEYPIGTHKRPWYGALQRAESASYPRDRSYGQELYRAKISEENIRKHADAMDAFRTGSHLGVPQWRHSYRLGREVQKKESELHAVYSEGLPIRDIEELGKWTDVRFNEDPLAYFQRTGRFLDPEVGGWQDLTELLSSYWR